MTVSVEVKLNLYSGKNKRQTPFISGYRPLFSFENGPKTSGQISLIDREKMYPGEDGLVNIKIDDVAFSKVKSIIRIHVYFL